MRVEQRPAHRGKLEEFKLGRGHQVKLCGFFGVSIGLLSFLRLLRVI